MRSSSNSFSQSGQTDYTETKEQKRDTGSGPHILYVIGIGPGHIDHLSQKAVRILKTVDTIAGYSFYIDLIRPISSAHQQIISSGMQKETERVHKAIQTVLSGRSCALISSGDPGLYAMAGLVFEICMTNNIQILSVNADIQNINTSAQAIRLDVIAGIPALCSGASLLGAPLMHDFAAISLSDLLTPWHMIEARIEAAAKADFVIVIYNPKSKKRSEHIIKAQQIIMNHRAQTTPVGIVRGATRENQAVCIVPLKDLHNARIDMQTTVFIGNSQTQIYCDFMVTPRGYKEKYSLSVFE
jgi:precorrin-3B C17-methyltransferase